jgi:hypothetical protein
MQRTNSNQKLQKGKEASGKEGELEALKRKHEEKSIKQIKFEILTRAGMGTVKANNVAYGDEGLSRKALQELGKQAKKIYEAGRDQSVDVLKGMINEYAQNLMGQIAKGNLSKYDQSNSRDKGLLSKFVEKKNSGDFDKKFEAALETQNDFREGKTGLRSVGNFLKKRLTDFSGKLGTSKALLIPVVLVALGGFPISIGGIIAGIIGGVVARSLIKRETDIKKAGNGFDLNDVEKYKDLRKKGINSEIVIGQSQSLEEMRSRIKKLEEQTEGKEKEKNEIGVGVGKGQSQSQAQDHDKRDFKRYSLNDNNLSSNSISNPGINNKNFRSSFELNKDMAEKILGDHDLNSSSSSSSSISSKGRNSGGRGGP